ncbi:MAG: N-acetylmuramoyl-L-alanine amidase [Acidobacteria bacterium]|nr:N-acetylmuramoyl-L-alanine amidase [Acidobacteriota bacterium]
MPHPCAHFAHGWVHRAKRDLLLLSVISLVAPAASFAQSVPATKPATTPSKQAPPAQPAINNNIIVLDPAHGGEDTGAHIGQLNEKDINMQLATRLRSLLQARTFDVKLLRDGDPTPAPTADQRAGAANQMHAAVCIVLHSSATGEGVHIYTSALKAASETGSSAIVRWDRAQTSYIQQSMRLSDKLSEALTRSRMATSNGRTFVAPLDALQCPAILIELGPIHGGNTLPSDTGYQQTVADAIAGTLLQWREDAKAVVKQ